MPQWEVIGADRTTGADLRRLLEATDADEAAASAGASMLVERVVLAGPPRAAPAPTPTAAQPVAAVEPPEYRGIVTGANVLLFAGVVAIGLGACAFLFAVVKFLGNDMSQGPTFVAAVLAAVNGVMLIFISSLGTAIRDMARNSFRR